MQIKSKNGRLRLQAGTQPAFRFPVDERVMGRAQILRSDRAWFGKMAVGVHIRGLTWLSNVASLVINDDGI